MSSRYVIPLLLAGAVVLACGSRSHSESAAAGPRVALAQALAAPPVPAPQPVKHVRLTEGAAPTLTSAFHVTREKSVLRFMLDVSNPGKKHLELSFPSGQEYDFAVLDAAGQEVYRWSASRMFTQSRQNRVLDGGDTLHIKEVGRIALPAGSYTAVATLRSTNFPISERVPVTVP